MRQRDQYDKLVYSQVINFQKALVQMLQNFPKLPLHPLEIDHYYSKYLNQNKLTDPSLKLSEMIKKENQSVVQNDFNYFVDQVLNQFDSCFKGEDKTLKVNQLNKIPSQNKPKFQQSREQAQLNLQKVIKQLLLQMKIQSTGPSNNQVLYFATRKQKNQFFQRLFSEYMQTQIELFKKFYQLKKISDLESIVIESFQQYKEKNNLEIQNMEQEKILKNVSLLKQEDRVMVVENDDGKSTNIFSSASQLIQEVATKGPTKFLAQKIYSSYKNRFPQNYQVNQQEQQKKILQIAKTIPKSHIKHIIKKEDGLSIQDFKKVQDFMKKNKKAYNIETIQQLFTQNLKIILIETLTKTIQHIKDQKRFTHLQDPLLSILLNFTQSLENKSWYGFLSGSFLRRNKTKKNQIEEKLPNVFYFVFVLYQVFQQNYCPHTRRILIRICHQIQHRIQDFHRQNVENKKFCLVHALKIMQSQRLNRSQICRIITNQKPFRQSQLPLDHQKQEYFEDQNKEKIYSCEYALSHLQHLIHQIHLFELKRKYEKPPKMQLLKLSHSKNKKNVNILISGFLSEDTNKFKEWMGIIEPTYDSEIYALKWESKTVQDMIEYAIVALKDLALCGGGIIGSLTFAHKIVSNYNSNPFIPCFQVANITGIFFAQVLIRLFDGHFINLIGFSLGTQVIFSTLKRLKQRGKLSLINKVITIGGVADKNEMIKMLQQTEKNDKNPISISWTNVHCIKDWILSYLLKLSMPEIVPVGLHKITYPEASSKKQQAKQLKMSIGKYDKALNKSKIYQVDNLDVQDFIDGHLKYRQNMKKIARFLGVKDQ